MIIFDKVTKQFGDDTIGVEDVSFQIAPGELVTITGPSGSGKTTLMRLLTKEYEPTTGEIIFNETPLSQIKSGKVHQHRRNIGVIFQDYKLLRDLNVWENIALALDIIGMPQAEIEERVTDLLELVGLTDKAMLFPVQLSGGEAQRVGIARALAPAPKVIFADEPTGNLDANTAKHIVSLFAKINQMGTTVLLSTHDSKVLDQLTDRMIELENGRLTRDSGSKSKSAAKSTAETTGEAKAKDKAEPSEDKTPEPKDDSREEKLDSKQKNGGNRITVWLGGLFASKPKTKPTEAEAETDDGAKAESEAEQKTSPEKSSKKKKKTKDERPKKEKPDDVTVSVEKI